jgi:mannan endo-1,4-beta-mannosidase
MKTRGAFSVLALVLGLVLLASCTTTSGNSEPTDLSASDVAETSTAGAATAPVEAGSTAPPQNPDTTGDDMSAPGEPTMKGHEINEPDIPATGRRTLDYLYSISSKRTLAGQHNREPNAEPAMWTDYIHEITGKYPALWSGDFLFQQDNIDNRWTMIHEAKKQWDQGAVINLMWHACPPDEGEPCGWDPGLLNAQLDDEQWEALLTDGTPLNEVWTTRMDDIAVYLQYLEDNGVEVLFRPFHEMNQGLFWWGGRPGPHGTAKLFRYVHDYFTEVKGLSNLVWVWDMQDLTRDFEDYNPGDDYWDVFAFDVYDRGFDASWYKYILPIVGEKPMAIGECARLPSSTMLAAQPRWVFFMPWAELVKETNSTEAIQGMYDDPRIITLDEMPGWEY